MIRILHVVPSLDVNAGMVSVVMNYYRHIDREKIQFDFLCFYKGTYDRKKEVEELGGRIFYLGDLSLSPKYFLKLGEFFKKYGKDYVAVHCHPIWAPIFVSPFAKINGIKHIIAHSHSTQFSDRKSSAIRNRIMMPLVRFFATDFMACSKAAAKLFGFSSEKTEKMYVLHNAIDTKKYCFSEAAREKFQNEFGIKDGEIVFGHVGRFEQQKNHGFLIEVFAESLKKNPNYKLVLIGDGTLREKIEQKAEDLGIAEHTLFFGKRSDVSELLSFIDVFLLPSFFEGAPVSAIEAQAAGLGCVLSDTITEEVNIGLCRYLSLDADLRIWAETLEKTAGEKHNRVEINEKMSGGLYDIFSEAKRYEDYLTVLAD